MMMSYTLRKPFNDYANDDDADDVIYPQEACPG